MAHKFDRAAFGRRFRSRMEKCGTNPNELSKILKISVSIVQRIAAGEAEKSKYLKALADALMTTTDWLLFEEGPEQNPRIDPRQRLAEIASSTNEVELLHAAFQLANRARPLVINKQKKRAS